MNGMIKKAWVGLMLGLGIVAGVNAGAATLTIAGTAGGTALVFASQRADAESPAKSVTLTAAGGTVTFNVLGIANSNFMLLKNNCGPSLAAGSSCSLLVSFTPFEPGTRYGELIIRSDADGSPHTVYLEGTAIDRPSAPATVSAVAGDGRADVTFTTPMSNGSTITGYLVNCTPACMPVTGSVSPITVSGLSNGISYTFTVTALVTGSVDGLTSAPSNAVIPRVPPTVPGAPTSVAAVSAGATSASVSFAAPASDGGSPITGYTVTSNPAGGVDTNAGSTALTHIITGLTTGAPYIFTVKATNGVGPSVASANSNAVIPTPPTVPGAPTIGTATRGDKQATVTFAAPASNGGSAILDYTATSSGGAAGARTGTCAGPAACAITVSGLTNNTPYTFTVKARNSVGFSVLSAASNAVTPVAATVPDAPTLVAATAGNAQATVTFTAPASNGGSAIQTYTATSNPGGKIGTCAGPAACAITVSGLTNGTAYTFTVTATNGVGAGPASAASNSVTPSVPIVSNCAQMFSGQATSNTNTALDFNSIGTNNRMVVSRGQSRSIQITTGAAGRVGNFMTYSDTIGASVQMFMNVSRSQCDFTYSNYDSHNGCGASGLTLRVDYSVGTTPVVGKCNLLPNTTYYVNIRDEFVNTTTSSGDRRGVNTCAATQTCGFMFQIR